MASSAHASSQVRMVDDAAERLRKRQRDEARASAAARKSANSHAAEIRAQVRAHARACHGSLTSIKRWLADQPSKTNTLKLLLEAPCPCLLAQN